ncbi:MAG: hypothetical protein CME64_07470 [Halobacteriovoraceae bacterium]|nr:hypothetical protein [Halobacteriovoraceae bacterium]|tara:strand:- start:558 stop:878 length:321 start_codon:yes stop_codon:yes gene_type:complete
MNLFVQHGQSFGTMNPMEMNTKQELRDEVLKTLSFFEPMSLEKIYLDFDQEFLVSRPDFVVEDLVVILKELGKEKLIKQTFNDGQKQWVRVYPKQSFWSRIKKLFK